MRRPLCAALVLALAAGCGGGGGGGTTSGGGGSSTSTSTSTTSSSSTSTGSSTASSQADASSGPSTGSGVTPGPLSGLQVSKACEHCHTSIFKDWDASPHSASLTSVVTVAQNNALYNAELKNQPRPDPAQFCVNCHSPLTAVAVLTTQNNHVPTLPFKDPSVDPAQLTEGIGCMSCHAYVGAPLRSIAGLSVYQDDFDLGGKYYGPFDDAAESTAHQSQRLSSFGKDAASALCITCHNTYFDRNNDNDIENPVPGVDLILQNTSAEFDQYAAQGGQKTCIDCHMPVVSGKTRAADGAKIGTDEQKTQAPVRIVRSHKFVGVDYPLDNTPDPSVADRVVLLQTGIAFAFENVTVAKGKLAFDVSLQNTETGHDFPTGFAFLRQLFVDVAITDAGGAIVASSGHLLSPTDDLCDKSTLSMPLGTSLANCPNPDLQLVNLQLQLVTKVVPGVDDFGRHVAVIDPALGKETVIENLAGGAVVRHRPSDGKPLAPLVPNEIRKYGYHFDVPGKGQKLNIKVKLRFRNLPPYFLRALGDLSPAQKADLTKALPQLKIIDIATVTQDILSP